MLRRCASAFGWERRLRQVPRCAAGRVTSLNDRKAGDALAFFLNAACHVAMSPGIPGAGDTYMGSL